MNRIVAILIERDQMSQQEAEKKDSQKFVSNV